MADDPTKKGLQDRNRVNSNEDYEVRYIAEMLNVTPDEIREAIKKVGNNRNDITEYISSKQ